MYFKKPYFSRLKNPGKNYHSPFFSLDIVTPPFLLSKKKNFAYGFFDQFENKGQLNIFASFWPSWVKYYYSDHTRAKPHQCTLRPHLQWVLTVKNLECVHQIQMNLYIFVILGALSVQMYKNIKILTHT